MKKKKKLVSSPRRSGLSRQKIKVDQGPPNIFMQEMTALMQAGKWDLFERKAREAVRRWPDHPLGWKALGNLLLMQGKHKEAVEPFTRCLRLVPDDAQTLNNLGSAFLGLRRLEEAEAGFRQAVALKPDYVQAHNNLGITMLEYGRFEEAVAAYRKAITIKPDFAEAHNNLGNALKELGRTEEAETAYRQAVVFNSGFAEAHSNLGFVLLELKRPGEAEESFRQAVKLKPDYPQAHNGLGDTLLKRGRLSEAIASYRQCLDLDPMWIKAHDGLNKALGHLVPSWHVPMMNDSPRNDAYFAALQNAITPDTHVLEIGTGSGLLAMMSARLGARQVTTCEAVAEIAGIAQAIVADNGFTPPVTVINKMSTKLEVGKDMDERADLLVSEILSSEFLGEGVLPSIEDARRRLLKPGGRIIPARGSIQFALFGGSDIEKNIRVDQVYGFDLGRFNTMVSRKQILFRNDLNIEMLSDETCAFFFDFAEPERIPSQEKKNIDVPVRKTGRCYGIIQWIRLEMDDTVVFENHPSVKNPAQAWSHCLYIFPDAMDVTPGQVIQITAAHNRITPWFFLSSEAK
ncbi:MAG: protein arginine N-methyltransferase [Desulfobulbaceae bacterium]|nr:protein arginine N-methyltransferase [Desulfobulbaceae bacterium]